MRMLFKTMLSSRAFSPSPHRSSLFHKFLEWKFWFHFQIARTSSPNQSDVGKWVGVSVSVGCLLACLVHEFELLGVCLTILSSLLLLLLSLKQPGDSDSTEEDLRSADREFFLSMFTSSQSVACHRRPALWRFVLATIELLHIFDWKLDVGQHGDEENFLPQLDLLPHRARKQTNGGVEAPLVTGVKSVRPQFGQLDSKSPRPGAGIIKTERDAQAHTGRDIDSW